jgi:putative peptidoglycan lipid II flippase
MRATPLLRAGALVAIIGAAAIAYFGVLVALGFRPRDFKRRAG